MSWCYGVSPVATQIQPAQLTFMASIVMFHIIAATTTTMSTNNMIYLKKWKNILELLD